jgi:hypothetical protein
MRLLSLLRCLCLAVRTLEPVAAYHQDASVEQIVHEDPWHCAGRRPVVEGCGVVSDVLH